MGKLHCFEKIQKEFPRSKCLIVGDGEEEERLSRRENVPFWKITSSSQLRDLYSKVSHNFESAFK